MNTLKRHPMQVVIRQTGLTPHTIRVWERRHNAVTPMRTPTNRRLYSDRDIERLKTLRHLTSLGHTISQIAPLPIDQLLSMIRVDHERVEANAPPEPDIPGTASPTSYLESCLDAIQQFDSEALERALTQAAIGLGRLTVIDNVIVPLMQQIGELWHAGVLRMTHEHLASAVVRSFLWNLNDAYLTSPHAPQLIIATPAGQLHEIGALIAAATARQEGWGVIYLGSNLPAEEIAAVVQPQVKAVALSIGYPPDDPHLLDELKQLRRYLPSDVQILVGGRVAHAYEPSLASIGAIQVKTLEDFRTRLEALREVLSQTLVGRVLGLDA